MITNNDTEIEVEVVVRVRSRAKGLTKNVTRGEVGQQVGASATRFALCPGSLKPASRELLAESVCEFAKKALATVDLASAVGT